ncbi:MAG: NAD(P)H-dependent oxidoreductase [Deltaproteobacteria bacterium]|nr:NAD(P)H-dependent oxidoreductase [Deltaproteobacteria bacterium]
MQLTIFNGSPKGKKSNTSVLVEHFLKGFMETEGNSYELEYIVDNKDEGKLVDMFKDASHVILAFPLYIDCMPGIVKSFIESLRPLCGKQDNPSIGFMVQGGFPEAYHSRFVERYLKKLAGRLNCHYAGCIIRGGFEATPSMPRFVTRKIFNRIYELGKAYGKAGKFDGQLINKLSKPELLSALRKVFFKIGLSLGLPNIYWDKKLKANNAFEKRFDRPFA